jgi:hypothetical protein
MIWAWRDGSVADGDEEWDRLMRAAAEDRAEDYWRDRDVRRVLPVNPPEAWRTPLCGVGPPSLGHQSFVVDRC